MIHSYEKLLLLFNSLKLSNREICKRVKYNLREICKIQSKREKLGTKHYRFHFIKEVWRNTEH